MRRMHYYYYYYSHFTMRKMRLGEAKQLACSQGAPKRYSWIRTQVHLTPKPKLLTTRSQCLCKGSCFFSPTVLSTILWNSTNAAAWLDNLTLDKPGCINVFWYSWVNSPEEKRNWSWGRWSTPKLGVCDNQVTFTRLLVPISQCQPSGPSENMCGFRT